MNNGYFLNYKYVWNIAGDIFIYTKKINRCLSKIQIEPGVLYFIWLPQTKPLGAPVRGPWPRPCPHLSLAPSGHARSFLFRPGTGCLRLRSLLPNPPWPVSGALGLFPRMGLLRVTLG